MNNVSTKTQVSAGGVAFRKQGDRIEVVLVSVGNDNRRQLPKGFVNPGESKESAAIREVREEGGIDTELVKYIDKIEYWYFSKDKGQTVRFHKFVFFYLLRYLNGNVEDHDQEVNAAEWVEINNGIDKLKFDSEKKVLAQARDLIE